jgi:hypothetical protein
VCVHLVCAFSVCIQCVHLVCAITIPSSTIHHPPYTHPLVHSYTHTPLHSYTLTLIHSYTILHKLITLIHSYSTYTRTPYSTYHSTKVYALALVGWVSAVDTTRLKWKLSV